MLCIYPVLSFSRYGLPHACDLSLSTLVSLVVVSFPYPRQDESFNATKSCRLTGP